MRDRGDSGAFPLDSAPFESAAEWYVDLDAEPADATVEAELAAWLARDARNEAGFERCEAALKIVRELEHDPELAWAFAEARALARREGRTVQSAPGGSPEMPGPARGSRVRVARLGVAAGLAAAAVTAALWLPGIERSGPGPTVARTSPAADAPRAAGPDSRAREAPRGSAEPGRSALTRALVDEAVAAAAPVVPPGHVIVDAGSVAVLPFVNLARNPADGSVAAHFDAGWAAELHAGIVRELDETPGIDVINGHAVMPYAGLGLPPGEVAARLGVRGIVRGSLRSRDDRVEVDVELVDAVNGAELWSLHASRPAELGVVREEIVSEVAAALAALQRRPGP